MQIKQKFIQITEIYRQPHQRDLYVHIIIYLDFKGDADLNIMKRGIFIL